MPNRSTVEKQLERAGAPEIVERKVKPDGAPSQAHCRLIHADARSVVLFHNVAGTWRVGPYTIAPPMYTVACYWKDTPYNLYAWYEEDGRLVAAYFNIVRSEGYTLYEGEDHPGGPVCSRAGGDHCGPDGDAGPRIRQPAGHDGTHARNESPIELTYYDLLLDVLVHPDGRCELEDEDEIEHLEPGDREHVRTVGALLCEGGADIAEAALARVGHWSWNDGFRD
jgi:hypothetical protein